MIFKLSPVRSNAHLSVVQEGDVLTLNGQVMDLSPLAEGATLPKEAVSSPFVIAPIERVHGNLVVTLMLPHAADAPESARFPADIYRHENGAVILPGLTHEAWPPAGIVVIDWSQVVSAEDKMQAAAQQELAGVIAETAQRRTLADKAIAPLQDAVDLGEATEAEISTLKEWKRFRVALTRLPEQAGYPAEIDWPTPPV